MTKSVRFLYLLALSAILFFASIALPQTTEFTYQGSFNESGQPANGDFELNFFLFDSLSAGSQVGNTITVSAVTVSNGSFSVPLDFGVGAFPGADRYLEIAVGHLNENPPMGECQVVNNCFILAPRNKVNSAPYAIRSLTVTGPLTGSDPTARLIVTNDQAGIVNPSPTNLPPAAIKAESTSTTAVTAGIIGISNAGTGIIGITTNDDVAITALATSPTGVSTGVQAEVLSPNGVAVEADTPMGGTGFLFEGRSGGTTRFFVKPNGDVNITGDLGVTGDLTVGGAKNNVVALADGRTVRLYALEAPESWFEDFGTVRLEKGRAIVKIDKIFSETTNTKIPYKVFLTPNGDCRGLYVTRKTADSFEVRELGGGKSDVSFDYRIVARRKGYETERFAPGPKLSQKK